MVAGWLASIPTAVVLYAVLTLLAPRLVKPPDLRAVADLFLIASRPWVAPEPLEQARYELAVTLVPIVQLVFTGMIRAYMAAARRKQGALRVCRLGAILAQIILVVFTIDMWVLQTRDEYPYFEPRLLFWVLAISALTARLAVYLLTHGFSGWHRARLVLTRLTLVTPRVRALTAGGAALVMAIVVVLPSLFTSRNAALALEAVNWHLPFTLDEWAAVLNGRSLQVDFFPQYQNLLPYVFVPVFNVINFTITTFMIAMLALSLISIICTYSTLCIVTQNRGLALLLYFTFIGIISYSIGTPPQVGCLFNYYAWPMRLVLPSLTMWLTARYLLVPTRPKMLVALLFGSFAAVNNLDFGLPALVGCVGAVLSIAEFRGLLPRPRDVMRVAGVLAVSMLTAMGTLAMLSMVRSGHLPNVGMVVSFQQIFVRYGFFMIPMPMWGIHWLLFITFMGALSTGATAVVSRATLSSRVSAGLLIYGAIFGCGVAMYYVGRSSPYSLIIVFWPWALCVLLLLWETSYAGWQFVGRRPLGDGALLVLPWFLLFVHGGLFLSNLVDLPNPIGQIERVSQTADLWPTSEDKIVALLRSNTTPGEKVGIVYPYGHLFALRAGVDDVFPFAHLGSMILRDQVRLAAQAFATNGVSKVFGSFAGEFQTALEERGFRAAEAVEIRYPQVPERFEMWVKRVP